MCPTCRKPIEIPKFRIHEATCARNNYKCPDCNEIVPKSEKEHHDQEYHSIVSLCWLIEISQIQCEFCKDFECEKSLIKDHLEYCEMKPKECKFCELKIPREQYDEHFKICGSKTKQCPDCKQHVKNRDQVAHKV